MFYKQQDILGMRQVIANNFNDVTWSVDDLTDIEVIHLYKSYFEDEDLFYYIFADIKEDEGFEF